MKAQLKLHYERQTLSSYTDGLTGLYNHGFFQTVLDHEFRRFRRFGAPFTLAMIDLDAFSVYNERHGPVAGDRTLKEVAQAIRQSIREVDFAARYGGDVFAVLLIGIDAQAAQAAAERIRLAAERLSEGVLTVSVGLASCPRDAAAKHQLIQKAQEALLRAKIGGKNRIFFYMREQTSPNQRPRVLVVDDERVNLELVGAILSSIDFEVFKATSGEEALCFLGKTDVDLVLLDILLPGIDGYEVCRRLKQREATRLTPVILLTGLDDLAARIQGIEAGADDFLVKPPNHMELIARTRSLVKVKSLNDSLIGTENVLISLARAVEAKDVYTRGHISRTSELAVLVGRRMGLSGKDVEALRLGGILHDIGKIGVPREILNKPGPLSQEEFGIIKSHPDVGHQICLPLKKTLGPAIQVIRYHHERLDGRGYPDGLRGEEIPIVASIMAIVDMYDALVSDRPYRKAMSKEEAFRLLREDARTGKLDRAIVETLIDLVETPPTQTNWK